MRSASASLLAWFGVFLALAALGVIIVFARPDPDFATVARAYNTQDSTFVRLPDGAIAHVRISGPADATPIVLLHGFASSAWAWNGWTDALDTDYRVIRIDLLGHGLTRSAPGEGIWRGTQARFVLDTLDALHVNRFVLGGNSMGGAVAWSLAVAAPDRVRALVLVDASGPSPEGPPAQVRRVLSSWYAPIVRFAARWAGGTTIMGWSMRSGGATARPITDSDVQRTDLFWRLHRGELVAAMTAPPSRDDVSLAAIKAPTLVMQGGNDALVPRATAEDLAQKIAHARLVIYPDLGHTPHEENPAATATDVRAFLATALKPGRHS